MAELATKPLTLDEFLHWDDGTDTHYELIGGFPLAMSLRFEADRILATRLATHIDRALTGRLPANVQLSVGVVPPNGPKTSF
jgi:hypothetical protein